MPLPIDELEERVAAAVTALDASAYQQGEVEAAWTESQGWGVALEGARSRAHLQFQASVTSTEVLERGTHGEPVLVRSRLAFLMAYLLRPGPNFVADTRAARQAALDAAKAINALDDASQEIAVRPVNLGQPEVSADSELMLIPQFYDIEHELVL